MAASSLLQLLLFSLYAGFGGQAEAGESLGIWRTLLQRGQPEQVQGSQGGSIE